jgi:F-type H+-transporting ATPase subunit alpha
MRNSKATVLNDIKTKQALDDALTSQLSAAIEEFKKGFRA